MIEIPITLDMIENAQKSANQMGSLNNSIKGIHSNLIGFLGEECFVKHYRNKKLCSFSRVNNYDFDFLLNGYRIEVKSKETTSTPSDNFTVNINSFNPHQEKQFVDYYFFIYILRENNRFTKGFIVGFMSKSEFLNKAILKKSGDIDGKNNHIIKHDCLCLQVKQLHKLKRIYNE